MKKHNRERVEELEKELAGRRNVVRVVRVRMFDAAGNEKQPSGVIKVRVRRDREMTLE